MPINMSPEALAEFEMMDKVLFDEFMQYHAYPLNIQRAIDELCYFIDCTENHKTSMNKLIKHLIKGRKNSYMNKNLDHDTNITNEEFIDAMDFSGYKPILIDGKIYFNCKIDPKAVSVLSNYEDRFIFKYNYEDYFDKNLVLCTMCKERYYYGPYHDRDYSYDISIGCKRSKFKWHQIEEVVNGVVAE